LNKLTPYDDDYEVIAVDGIAVVGSRKIAEMFKKEHKNVLAAIDNCGCSDKFSRLNFKLSHYNGTSEGIGKKVRYKEYLLTKDGFALIVMGFTGKKAMRFKEAYINRFNQMEAFIQSRNLARIEYPELTDMIKSVHEKPMFYHFSNEADMINKIVTNMTSKQFKANYGLEKTDSIRDYMTNRQLDFIQKLQKVDVGLVAAIPDFKIREKILAEYHSKLVESADMKAIN